MSFERALTQGDDGPAVRRAQEWLTLSGLGVKIDGVFGPATVTAVRDFQSRVALEPSGVVEQQTFLRLVSPIATASAPITATASYGADIVRAGEQHLAQRPREIGGQNRGPWVRLYMNGEEGTEFPWYAGFVSFLMRQAANGRALPFEPSESCDEIAQRAKQRGLFRQGGGTVPADVGPGSLFLVRRKDAPGFHHTGVVVAVNPDSIVTIEGNTNDDGSREGYEAIRRVRGLGALDFVVIPG